MEPSFPELWMCRLNDFQIDMIKLDSIVYLPFTFVSQSNWFKIWSTFRFTQFTFAICYFCQTFNVQVCHPKFANFPFSTLLQYVLCMLPSTLLQIYDPKKFYCIFQSFNNHLIKFRRYSWPIMCSDAGRTGFEFLIQNLPKQLSRFAVSTRVVSQNTAL